MGHIQYLNLSFFKMVYFPREFKDVTSGEHFIIYTINPEIRQYCKY